MNTLIKNILKIYRLIPLFLGYFFIFTSLFCYQPQSGSLPRWSKGIGLQTGYQNKQFANQINSLYWVEGAYSFTRSLGITKRITWNKNQNTAEKSKENLNYHSLKIKVPYKIFFDEESITWNSFIVPTLVYYLPEGQLQGGATVGLFRESFDTYFTLAFSYLTPLNEIFNQNLTDALPYYTVKSDLGFHLYYNEESLIGIWALVKINLHQFLEKNLDIYHLTIQPTLLAYYESTTLILRYAIPVWQENNYPTASDRDRFFLKGAFEIGFATAF